MAIMQVRIKVQGTPLPTRVKRKWAAWDKESVRSTSLEQIEAKLSAAEQRREVRESGRISVGCMWPVAGSVHARRAQLCVGKLAAGGIVGCLPLASVPWLVHAP